MTYQQQISIATNGHGDMHDLAEQVTAIVNASAIKTGTVNIFTSSTAGSQLLTLEGAAWSLPFSWPSKG
jgi:thiamine phosphate synthase YjbQ (UPF0047 family)